MIYLFSSIPVTIIAYLKDKNIPFRLVPKEEFKDFLAENIAFTKEDLGISYSYGKIFPESLLNKLRIVNIHFSILPNYRGAVPVEAAILDGVRNTGITLQWTDKKMDEGDILLQKEITLNEYTTAGEARQIMDAAIPQMLDTLFATDKSGWEAVKQEGDVSYCYKTLLNRENAFIDFRKVTIDEIVSKVYAFNPQPFAWTYMNFMGNKVEVNIKRVERIELSDNSDTNVEILWLKKKGMVIFLKNGPILITEMVIEGKKTVKNGEIVSLKGRLELV